MVCNFNMSALFTCVALLVNIIALSSAFLLNLPLSARTNAHAYSCDDVRNAKCLIRFNAHLGIPTGIGAQQFFEHIQDYYQNNGLNNGFAGICGAANLLKLCEGDDFPDCLSVRGFEEQGANLTDAIAFASYAGALAYECAQGYDVFYNALPCIGQTYASSDYQRTMAQCASAFEKEVSRDPKDACAYYQEYAECLSKAMVSNCGNTAGQAYCNAVTNGFKYLDGNCNNLKCKYSK